MDLLIRLSNEALHLCMHVVHLQRTSLCARGSGINVKRPVIVY